jgi:hypothetical protein
MKKKVVTLLVILFAIFVINISITATKGYSIISEQKFNTISNDVPKVPYIQACNPDGICTGTENNRICSLDCPSGGKDNFCDTITDGVCDPDCLNGKGDYDCTALKQTQLTAKAYIITIGLFIIVISILLLIYYRQKGDRKIITQTQDLELRNFISNALARGYTPDQIKAKLLSIGWKEEAFSRFLK